jgi:uncharacterized protein (TIGR04222 family)
MKTQHIDLWKRVENFTLDDSNSAFPFSKRLARDNGWSLPYTRRVIHEYKRFAFLAVAAGNPVTPSDQVDQAWHLHLLYTQSYWKEFCGEVLRQPLHHGPTKGGARERDKFNDWYARTLASYRAFFDEEPPADIWPAPVQRFGDDIHFARVNTARNWVVPKPAWIRQVARALVTSWKLVASAPIAALILVGCTGEGNLRKAAGWPFDLSAGLFLEFFLVTWAATTGIAVWWRWQARTPGEMPEKALPELDAYDMAFLAGGKNRAAFAAVASLTHQGALEIDGEEHRLRRSALPDTAHSFEASIHRNIAVQTGSFFKAISEQCPTLPECARIEEKLKQLGLLTTPPQWGNVSFIPTLIALIVPAIGFIRIVIGLMRDKPVGILAVLSLVSLGTALWFATRPHRTRRDDAVLTRMREKYVALKSQPYFGESALTWLALPLAIGLFGPSVLNGTALAELQERLQAKTGGSEGGGCGGGCGAGCGGGCGGCGGCG